MNRLKRILRSKIFIVSVSAILIYTLGGFFLVPFLVRHYVPKIAQEELKKEAAIGEVRFNPYIFTFEANGFRLEEPGGEPIAGFGRLFIDFELKSLFKWAWTFRQILMEAPLVNAVIAPDGALNLAQLAPPSEPEPPDAQEGPPPRLIVEQLSISEGRVDLTDRRQSEPAVFSLMPLSLAIENLNTLPEQEGPKTITAAIGGGGALQWSGRLKLNPLATHGTLTLKDLPAASLWKFGRDQLNLAPPAGTLGVSADYTVDLAGAEPRVAVANLSVTLAGLVLKLADEQAAFLELPDTRIRDGRFDLGRRTAEIGMLTVSGGRARIDVAGSGELNLERILKPASETAASPASPPVGEGVRPAPWKINLEGFDLSGFAVEYRDHSREPGLDAGVGAISAGFRAAVAAGAGAPEVKVDAIAAGLSAVRAGLAGSAAPEIRLDRVTLEGGAYELTPNLFTLEKLAVAGGGIDLVRQADGAINLALLTAPPDKGAIAREAEEAAAESHPFRFLVKSISVGGLGAAVSDRSVRSEGALLDLEEIGLTLTNVDGKSPMTFDAGLAVRQGGKIKAAGSFDPTAVVLESELQLEALSLTPFQPYIAQAANVVLTAGEFSTRGTLRHGVKAAGAGTLFKGGFRVENLRVIEPGASDTLVGWKSVQTDQLVLQLAPNKLEVGDLRVVQPAGKFIIEKDGSLNLANVIKPGPGPETSTPAEAGKPFPVLIRRVLVSEGLVDFADLSLLTPFGTKIHELKGNVAGVSTVRDARAQVKLDGRVDAYGTARVDGELNTSDPKAFTNIGLTFRNVEMSNLTPYSGKFAGRKIDSGKLSVDLKYKIDKSRLAGDNRIVVERLKLGAKVPSPEAVDLPLDFAVALLEDTNGVIDLGLPVSGNLDSPEFSFGALIWKALGNLITKIVTSPFRALGALLPGGGEEEFNAVAFEPGRSDVPPPEKEKLAKLASALQKRPQLRLTVQGRYHPQADRAELQSAHLRKALAERQGVRIAPGEEPGPVDFSSPDTGMALEAMFTERFGAEALKTLQAEMAATEEKARKEAAAKAGGASPPAEDPGRLAKLLFARLVAAEPIGEPQLAGLAEARSQAVAAELSGPGGIAVERVGLSPPAAIEKEKEPPPTAVLNLEAAR